MGEVSGRVRVSVAALVMAVAVAVLAQPAVASVVFDETFSGSAGSAPSAAWVGHNYCDGWGNLECNTNRAVNMSLDGAGHLKITARKESWRDSSGRTGSYTSARVATALMSQMQTTPNPRAQYTFGPHGWVGVLAKMPNVRGAWPGIWGVTQGDTTHRAEFDLCETPTYDATIIPGGHCFESIHMNTYSATNDATTACSPGDLSATYHWYWMQWFPGHVEMGVDSTTCVMWDQTFVSPWLGDSGPMNIMLGIQVGGWAGTPVASQFPATMLVDEVIFDSDPGTPTYPCPQFCT